MSGSRRHSVAEAARLLGIIERGVRDRIERGTLDAVKQEGRRGWRILLPPDAVAESAVPTAPSGSSRGSETVGEAVVTPALVEQAIARTGQQYTADLWAMLAELRQVYDGQIAAKDETIAELRRRAEEAEGARDRLAAVQAAQGGPGAREGTSPTILGPEPSAGLWTRLRRVFGGGRDG